MSLIGVYSHTRKERGDEKRCNGADREGGRDCSGNGDANNYICAEILPSYGVPFRIGYNGYLGYC